MSLSREDWRTLSAILKHYADMKLSGDWHGEPDYRQMLTTWMRDHDMPLEPLEGYCTLMYNKNDLPCCCIRMDVEANEIVDVEISWLIRPDRPILGGYPKYQLLARRLGGEYQIEVEV